MKKLTLYLNGHFDKLLHHTLSFLIAMSLFAFFPVIISVVIAIVLGLLKEASDHYHFNRWSWVDLVADITGVLDAVLIYYLIIT